MSAYWPYETPTPPCSGRSLPGTVDLLKYLMLKFPATFSMGIYSCRDYSGGNDWSIHSDGRAIDLGIPFVFGRVNTVLGDPIVTFLHTYAYEFGLHGQIWNQVRYDSRTPQGRVYTGPNPHYDHNHIEQRSHHATNLRYANYVEIAGSPTATPAPTGGSNLLPLTSKSSPEDIRWLQDLLNYNRAAPLISVTGVWDAATTNAVKTKYGSLGKTTAQKNGLEVGYNQWNSILLYYIRKVDD